MYIQTFVVHYSDPLHNPSSASTDPLFSCLFYSEKCTPHQHISKSRSLFWWPNDIPRGGLPGNQAIVRHRGRAIFPHFPIRIHFKKFSLERFLELVVRCGRVFQVSLPFLCGTKKQVFSKACLVDESPVPDLTSSTCFCCFLKHIHQFLGCEKMGSFLSPIFQGEILFQKMVQMTSDSEAFRVQDYGWRARERWSPKKKKRKAQQGGSKNQLFA